MTINVPSRPIVLQGASLVSIEADSDPSRPVLVRTHRRRMPQRHVRTTAAADALMAELRTARAQFESAGPINGYAYLHMLSVEKRVHEVLRKRRA